MPISESWLHKKKAKDYLYKYALTWSIVLLCEHCLEREVSDEVENMPSTECKNDSVSYLACLSIHVSHLDASILQKNALHGLEILFCEMDKWSVHREEIDHKKEMKRN